MKLTKRHIGKFFDVYEADGSWYYQLLDVKNKELLFVDSCGNCWKEENTYRDWRHFKPVPRSKAFVEHAWTIARKTSV